MRNGKNGIMDAKLFSYGQHTVSSFPKEYPQGFYFLFARMMLTLSLALNIVDMDIHHVHYCNGSLLPRDIRLLGIFCVHLDVIMKTIRA